MTQLETSPTEPLVPSPGLPKELLLLGVVLPALVVVVDQQLLARCVARHNDPAFIIFTFAVFVLQIGVLSRLVGSRVTMQPYWWGIFAWSIILVDLQVFSLAGPASSWSNPVKAFGNAFGSAQIGLVTCWGLLGRMKWNNRFPIAVVGFALSWGFCLSLAGRGNWISVMFLQCVATILVCAVLRYFQFTIDDVWTRVLIEPELQQGRIQFSIRHLFYWTTGTATLVGVGRLVGIDALTQLFGLSGLTVYAPAFTLISVISFWAALGPESWLIRFPVLLLTLPTVGGLLGTYEGWRDRRGSWNGDWQMMPWNSTFQEKLVFWIVWASLAGMLLTALVLVFRAAGQRLVRGAATVR